MHGSSTNPKRTTGNSKVRSNPSLAGKAKTPIKQQIIKPKVNANQESSSSKLPPIHDLSHLIVNSSTSSSRKSMGIVKYSIENSDSSNRNIGTKDSSPFQSQSSIESPKITESSKSNSRNPKRDLSNASSTSSMSTKSDKLSKQNEQSKTPNTNQDDNTQLKSNTKSTNSSVQKTNSTSSTGKIKQTTTDQKSIPGNQLSSNSKQTNESTTQITSNSSKSKQTNESATQITSNSSKSKQTNESTAQITSNSNKSKQTNEIDEVTEQLFYSGLENQGATCYMNSVLQSLYHLPLFRSLVFQIPTSDEEDPEHSIALNLQTLFYTMQPMKTPHSVSTKFLTTSFGWDSHQAFEQQDLQEFFRVLLTKLGEKIDTKNKKNEKQKINHISDIFKGQTVATISGKTDDFISERFEDFYDVSLSIKNLQTLENAFRNYTKKEDLSDEYDTGIPGKQKISVQIQIQLYQLPKVLTIHLQRFEYDFIHDTLTKIYDELQYPQILDLTPFVHKKSEHFKSEMERKYVLLGILVHSGDPFCGHYYAYLQPFVDDVNEEHFYQFNDTFVTEATHREVYDDNFGGFYQMSQSVSKQPKRHSAYMLIYGRLDCINEIFTAKVKISKNIAEYAQKISEIEDQPKMELVSFITEAAIKKNIQEGKTGIFSRDEIMSINVNTKNTSIESLYIDIAEKLNVDCNLIRLWSFDSYEGVKEPLIPAKEIIEDIPSMIYVQSKLENESFVVKPTQILLIFKIYTRMVQEPIQFCFQFLFKRTSIFESIKNTTKSIFGFSEDCQIRLFEELDNTKYSYTRKTTKENKYLNELNDDQRICDIKSFKNGSIIIIESSERVNKDILKRLHYKGKIEEKDVYNYVDRMITRLPVNVVEYYDMKFNVKTVDLYDFEESSNLEFLVDPNKQRRDVDPFYGKFEFPHLITLDQLIEFFNSVFEFNVDSENEKQLLFKYSSVVEGPSPFPIESIEELNKSNTAVYIQTVSNETTDKMTINVQYSHSSYKLSQHYFFYRSENDTVRTFLKIFTKYLSIKSLRGLLVNQHRIIRQLNINETVDIFEDSILRIDNIASINLSKDQREIRVFHAVVRKNSDSLIPMDVPFLLAVGITETADSVKKRIGQVLGYSADRLNHVRLYCADDDDFDFDIKNVMKKEEIVFNEINDPDTRSLIIVHSSEESFRHDYDGLGKGQGVQIK